MGGPLRFCTSYGPYVACYWAIKRDFARSPAAQLPLLPLSEADGKDHKVTGGIVSRWLVSIRRDIELDTNLRNAEPGSHRRCALQLCIWVCAVWFLLITYAMVIVAVMPYAIHVQDELEVEEHAELLLQLTD